jgi:hypothetical protein
MKDKESISVKGFGRLQWVNVRTGKIDRDTGWGENAITESGFDDAIVGAIGGIAASSQITHLQLGTQTDAAASTQTALSGEFGARKAATNSLVGAGTLQATANWATNEGTESTFGAIGAYGSSSGSSALNVLVTSTSAKTTDQELNATVQWRFS